jgi:solute carrier family 45 protein 1/2/4
MTGGAFFPTSGEEYDLDGTHSGGHAVQWVGKPGVKGPRWARLPLLTVGMLGIQVSGVIPCIEKLAGE